jgi:hypothetical protein
MDEQQRPTRCRVAAARAEMKEPLVWVGQAVKQVVTDAEGMDIRWTRRGKRG